MRNPKTRVLFSIISAIIFLTFLYDSSPIEKWSNKNILLQQGNEVKKVEKHKLKDLEICPEFFDHEGYKSNCAFLLANPSCTSGGFFNYIKFFYCDCENYSYFGYFVLASWLAILFYLLGNTASDYFCCSLESLSDLLKMSPTVAGVTLLPLGNGASDVFASIAAFMGTGSGDVGLNGVLGACVFITCVVVGVVSLSVASKKVKIDKKCFFRDIGFLLFTVSCLTVIMVVGTVTIWGAIAFLSIYVVYVVFVLVSEVWMKKSRRILNPGGCARLLPVIDHDVPLLGEGDCCRESSDINKDAHWIWHTNFAMYSDCAKATTEDGPWGVWGWSEDEEHSMFSFSNLCWLLEIPFNVPRRLTIPVIEDDRWSKMYAVASVFFAPVLLAFLWNTRENITPMGGKIAYLISLGIGLVLSVLAFIYTTPEHPPRKFLPPWIIGGFVMSIIWFYIVADELVSLLVSLGTILGINPSMLALTVLAWGNSMNDLMSNTAFAMNDDNGVQIAMSGCYAGPMFNTLIGLGISLLFGAWSMGSEPYVVPRDSGLFLTVGFLTTGLIWALVVLPKSDMRPNKVLGVGLIILYALFLSIRLSMAMGFASFDSLGFGLV